MQGGSAVFPTSLPSARLWSAPWQESWLSCAEEVCGFGTGVVVKGMGVTYICGLFVSQFQLFLCIFKGFRVFVQLILSALQLLL